MVLQRAPQETIVWGYGDNSSAPIILTMNNQVYYTISSSSADTANVSIWSVTFDVQTEEGPFQVKVIQLLANRTLETITLNHVLFVDVGICLGQSNMQFPANDLFNGSIEIENAGRYPKGRLLLIGETVASTVQEEPMRIGMPCSVASNTTVSNPPVSAVC